MEASLTFLGPLPGLAMTATSGSGQVVAMDTAESHPRNGASPRELVLIGLAGCAAMDVAAILDKKRQPPTGYRIDVRSSESDEHPQVFTAIEVTHLVEGDVSVEALRRAIELSATKYCPVSRMLSATVPIEHRFRLIRPGEPELAGNVLVTGPDTDFA